MSKTIYHKHKGAESKGKFKSHAITQQHKDDSVKHWHNEAIKKQHYNNRYLQKTMITENKKLEKALIKNSVDVTQNKVMLNVDEDDYITLDLDKCNKKGLRLTLSRDEGRHKKTVALQFDNEASDRSGLGKLTKEEYK